MNANVAIAAVLGLVFGLIAGWLIFGGGEASTVAAPAPADAASSPAAESTARPRAAAPARRDDCSALHAEVAALRRELERNGVEIADEDAEPVAPILFDDLPEQIQPDVVADAVLGLQEWMAEQDAGLGYRVHGLDCDEAPCLLHVEWDQAGFEGGEGVVEPSALLKGELQRLLGYYPASTYGFSGLHHSDGSGERHVSWLALFDPGAVADEATTAGLEAAARRRSQAARPIFMEQEGR